HCLILSPRDPWKICWDVFIGTLIIYTIITLTWRIGFDQEARGVALAFEYSVDVIFAVDTVLCFRTGFFVEDVLVTDWEKIAKRYCMTYFLFDLLSWFPIDLIVQVLTGQSSSGMRSVKLMKFVRLVRLAKLIRLFKLNRFLVIMEEKLHLKPAVIRMVRLIINIVFLAHLLACMWHFIALPACGVESEEVSAIGPCPEGLEPDRPNWIRLRASLEALLQELGAKREMDRAKQHREEASEQEAVRAEEPDRMASFSFTADLVVREEATGFELWIGSLEDALNLCALRDRGIDAVLNCAHDECEAEIACFKPQRCQRRARTHTRNASMGVEASLGAGWLGLRRDQIWSLASFDADWYSDVLELDVLYEALPARDEAGYDMQGHRQKATSAARPVSEPRRSPGQLRRLALSLAAVEVTRVLTRAPARGAAAGARRCRCVDCGRPDCASPALGASKPTSRGLRFVFFDERSVDCPAQQEAAQSLVRQAKGRFRAEALIPQLFAGRIAEAPGAGCRWQDGEWFAAVLEDPGSEVAPRPVAVYHGGHVVGSPKSEAVTPMMAIEYLESTKEKPIRGATAWGFSMLLHRLKLSGTETCKLVDESEVLPQPVMLDGREFLTKGSLIYGRSNDRRRPYAFPFRERLLPFSSTRQEYVYDLTAEKPGELYPDAILDFLSECRRHGRKVLVHCIMGVNRSAWATVAFLAGAMGMSLKEAVTLAAQKRGCVLSNPAFLDQLIISFATKEAIKNGDVPPRVWLLVSARTKTVAAYIASFHFITATMMAVGYGDIWAKNTEERLFCIMLQLFGATAFGFILSSVTCLLESANPRANETNKRVNEIKEWCAGRRIPRYLRMAIREHTQYVLQKKSIFNEADILANMPMSIRMDVIQNSYAEWLRVLERPFHEEDLALRTELAQLMMPQQVLQNEMMIEEGEITSEVYVVQHGCLEMVTSEYTADLPSINWVSACLKRSALGDTADTEDDTSEESDQAREVLCGLCRSSDVVGQVVAAPIMVRGLSSRTDVLAISKDCLVDVLLRFPGAVARSEAAEERAKAEMTKVLESELKYNPYGERECKSLVLLRGVASGAAELPPVVLNADRTQPIPPGRP
ncbi:unnamed protein product, partial [Effrenium voratum]